MSLSNRRWLILWISFFIVFSLAALGQNPVKKQTLEERLRTLLPDRQKVLAVKDAKGEIWIFRASDAVMAFDQGKGMLVLRKGAYLVTGSGNGTEKEIVDILVSTYVRPPPGSSFETTWKSGGKPYKISGIQGNATQDITIQVAKIVKAFDCMELFKSPCK